MTPLITLMDELGTKHILQRKKQQKVIEAPYEKDSRLQDVHQMFSVLCKEKSWR